MSPTNPPFQPQPSRGTILLENERKNNNIPVRELTYIIDGGKENTEKREWMRNEIVLKDPILSSQSPSKYYMTREERYVRSVKILRQLVYYKIKYNMDKENDFPFLYVEALNDAIPTMLHDYAFLPFLKKAASPEMRDKLVPLAENYAIIGSYSQTELGHGSNVQRLECTSTYIEKDDQFELNTPTLTSMKWWPGCLGQTCTHTILMARLIIKGKDYGIHPFLLQVRCMNTHQVLPGITIGEIGPKMGTDAIDNGYLKLNRVRIPRENLFMGFCSVDSKGNYTPPAHPKLAYVGMLSVRVSLVQDAARNLAQAVTIAVRYSIVRQQFSAKDNSLKEESSVLDYSMQQYRLLPSLAASYALVFTGRAMKGMFTQLEKDLKIGKFSLLGEIHSVSSGFKTFTTTIAGEGIEQCRLCCGGHGYTKSSGIPDLYTAYIGVLTAEGENYLLTQQTGRYLLKIYEKVLRNEKITMGYTTKYLISGLSHFLSLSSSSSGTLSLQTSCKCSLCSCPVGTEKEGEESLFLSTEVQLAVYQRRTIRLLHDLANEIQRQMIENLDKLSFLEIWNSLQVEIYRVSRAHCQYLMVKFFIEAIQQMTKDGVTERIVQPLKYLSDLFALYNIEKELGEFSQDGYLSHCQITLLRQQVKKTMSRIRPLAISLADAFNFSDHQLDSCLGRFDGNVYETLYQYVLDDPQNGQITKGYKYLRPLIRQEFFFDTDKNNSKL